MVLGPFAQLVIAQLAPNVIFKGLEVLGSEIQRDRSGIKPRNAHHLYRCPGCGDRAKYRGSRHYDSLQCKCGLVFPRRRGGRRCECGTLCFPESFSAMHIQCPNCSEIWKLANDGQEHRLCKCNNLFQLRNDQLNKVTSCCGIDGYALYEIRFSPPVMEVPSEATRM